MTPLFFGLFIYRNPELFNPWISNYVPDGMWAYSFSSSLSSLHLKLKSIINIIIVSVVGAFLETLQWYKLVDGTFDIIDILIYFLFTVFAVYVNQIITKYQGNLNNDN